MRHRFPLFIFCILPLVATSVAPSPAAAQSIVRGEVEGRVQDPLSGPIPEAEVSATNVRTGLLRWTVTDRDGLFRLPSLPPGEYVVRVEALGFRPVVYESVPIRPGQGLELQPTLSPAPPPVSEVDTLAFAALQGGRYPAGTARWVSDRELAHTPDLFRSLSGLATLSSEWDASLGVQGLPGRFSSVYVDGVPFTEARHPFREGSPLALGALPRAGIDHVQFLETPVDMEWSGAPGGYVATGTRSARSRSDLSVFGMGSTDPLWSGTDLNRDRPTLLSWWGGATGDLPLAGDSSRVFVAVEGMRVETPRSPGIGGSIASRIAEDLQDDAEIPGGEIRDVWLDETQVFSGLLRLDWSFASGTDVTARVNVSRTEDAEGRFFGAPPIYGESGSYEGTDLSSLVSVSSPLGSRFLLEVRGGFQRSERTFGEAADGLGSALPSTYLLTSRDLVGKPAGTDGTVLRSEIIGSPIVHFDLNPRHRFKGGVELSAPSYEYDLTPYSVDRFFFSRVGELESRDGAFVGMSGATRPSSFSVPKLDGFVQYRWTPVSELTLTSGIRYGREFVPTEEATPSSRWEELTGLSNADLPSTVTTFGGRIGVAWDLTGDGSTLLHGSVATHHGGLDPAALHEVFALDGSRQVLRAVGPLGSWPEAPDAGSAGSSLPILALLDPNVEAPRTARAAGSIQQRLGPGTTFRFGGTFRRTEYLLRRHDLNLPLAPTGATNLDRPTYGDLAKVGAVVRAEPGTNRRFDEFDRVWALNSDGWSESYAVGMSLEHTVDPWLDLFAGYTYSSTEDNTVGVGMTSPEARVGPHLVDGSGDPDRTWESGVSDFDVPHRLVTGLDLHLDIPGIEAMTLGGVYRFESGVPFTPSYPRGTDVNGDGSGFNDPAFVPDDPAIAELAGEWSCLNAWIGRVVERNACRAPSVHTVDAHLTFSLFRVRESVAELVVEGLNLLDNERGLRDAALLIVDPDAPLVDDGAGNVEIPTTVNAGFGNLLHPTGWGRRIRIGFKVGAQ